MATKDQQYTGRLYTQAEVDRMVREARVDELKKLIKDWGYGEYPLDDPRHSMDWEDYANYRIAELSKEEV